MLYYISVMRSRDSRYSTHTSVEESMSCPVENVLEIL